MAGVVLGVVGFFLVPVVGAVLGAVAGVLAVHYRRTGDLPAAWEATKGVLWGFGLAALVQVAAGLSMVAVWGLWAVRDLRAG